MPWPNAPITSGVGLLLPIQHVRFEVGSLSRTGPIVLDASFSHLDPQRAFREHITE
jgi:hypothetical protein